MSNSIQLNKKRNARCLLPDNAHNLVGFDSDHPLSRNHFSTVFSFTSLLTGLRQPSTLLSTVSRCCDQLSMLSSNLCVPSIQSTFRPRSSSSSFSFASLSMSAPQTVLPWGLFADVFIGVRANNSVTNRNTFQDASVGVLISVLGQLNAAALQLVKSDTLRSLSTVTEPMNRLFPAFLGLRFVGKSSVPRPTIPELEFVRAIPVRCHRIGRFFGSMFVPGHFFISRRSSKVACWSHPTVLVGPNISVKTVCLSLLQKGRFSY